jgi:hypothetical protein
MSTPPPPATRAVLRALTATPPVVGALRLRPVTVAHALAMEAWEDSGGTATARMTPQGRLSPAWVAALWTALTRDSRSALARAPELGSAPSTFFARATTAEICTLLDWWAAAWATALPCSPQSDAPRLARGLGWAAELVCALARGYSLAPDTVLYDLPLPHLFLWAAALHQSEGGRFYGPDYAQQDFLTPHPTNH